MKCLNGPRHALSRQSTNSAAPNSQPSCPSGRFHVFLSPGRPSLYSPFPRELLVCKPHSTPATPTPANKKNACASLTCRPPTFPWLGIHPLPGPSPGPSAGAVPGALGSEFSRRALPHRLPRLQALPGNPDHEVRGFLPPAPLEVTPAWQDLGRRCPRGHNRPLHPPNWAGRRPRNTSPRALARPNAGSGAALPARR